MSVERIPGAEPSDVAATPWAPTVAQASRSVSVQLVGRGLVLALGVVSTALVTRHLGDGYAAWGTVVLSMSVVSVLLEPGLSQTITRRIAVAPAEVPSPWFTLAVRAALGIVAVGVVTVIATRTGGSALLPLALLLGGQVLARSLVNNATGWLVADQRLHRLVVWEVALTALGVVGVAVGVRVGWTAPVLGLVGFTAPLGLLAIRANRELVLTPSAHTHRSGSWRSVRSALLDTLPLSGAVALNALYTKSSVYFVNTWETVDRAADFFFAFVIADQATLVAAIAAGAALPLLAARSRTVRMFEDADVTHRLLVAFAALGTLLSAGLLGGAPVLTAALGGPARSDAVGLILLLSPFATVICPAMVMAYVYVSMGLGPRYLVINAVGLVANLALSAAIIPTGGAEAASRVTWATEIFVAALPLVPVARSGPRGARTVLRVAALGLASILAGEGAARAVAPPWVAGLGLLGVAVLLTHREVRWAVRAALGR